MQCGQSIGYDARHLVAFGQSLRNINDVVCYTSCAKAFCLVYACYSIATTMNALHLVAVESVEIASKTAATEVGKQAGGMAIKSAMSWLGPLVSSYFLPMDTYPALTSSYGLSTVTDYIFATTPKASPTVQMGTKLKGVGLWQ